MTYMLLVLEPHDQRAERGEEGGREAYAQMQRYADDLKTRGVLRGYSSLLGDAEGRRLQGTWRQAHVA